MLYHQSGKIQNSNAAVPISRCEVAQNLARTTILKPSNSSHSLHSTNHTTGPAKSSRVNPNRTWREFSGLGIMPATILGAGSTVLSCVLVAIDHAKPFLANQWRVDQNIDLLAMEERLGIQISVS